MAENETEISTLGEFGLIDRLTEGMSAVNESTVYGVGDDAAVLNYPSDRDILVTTDMLLENVHFDLTYVPLKHLGYKSAIVNFSDICAMNGTPRQITVSLGISKRFTVEHIVDGELKAFTLSLGEMTDDERQIILDGCLINYNRVK